MKLSPSLFVTPLLAMLVWSGGRPVMAAPAHAAAAPAVRPLPLPALNPADDASQGVLFPFTLLDYALYNHTDKDSNVDYLALKNNQYLDRFAKAVAAADIKAFPVFTDQTKKQDSRGRETVTTVTDHSWETAFWINAYNGLLLKTIADAYPIDSPDNIKDLDTAKTHIVAGTPWSFRELRAHIAKLDPRALFALTDGTRGGPLLWNMAFRYSCGEGCNLADQLNKAASIYINDERHVELDRVQNEVTVPDFLATIDEYFIPRASKRKWDGIRYLLQTYTGSVRNGKSYYTTNEYTIKFKKDDRNLNNRNQG